MGLIMKYNEIYFFYQINLNLKRNEFLSIILRYKQGPLNFL